MKRLLILCVVAVAASNTGCRSCSSWWNRGSSCDACVSGAPMTSYSNGGTLVSPGVEVLPGPAEIVTPRGG
jgi:hypothetical protein